MAPKQKKDELSNKESKLEVQTNGKKGRKKISRPKGTGPFVLGQIENSLFVGCVSCSVLKHKCFSPKDCVFRYLLLQFKYTNFFCICFKITNYSKLELNKEN